jgi:hypothetical protein
MPTAHARTPHRSLAVGSYFSPIIVGVCRAAATETRCPDDGKRAALQGHMHAVADFQARHRWWQADAMGRQEKSPDELAHKPVPGRAGRSQRTVLRSVLQRRRRSNPVIDEVEDGGRAQMIEEAICHVIYDHGRDHDLSSGDIDINFASYIKRLAGGLEVSTCSLVLFSRAISLGYSTFNNLRSFGGGQLSINLTTRNLTFYPPR